MQMKGWIQSADFGTQVLDQMDLPSAKCAFIDHDWSNERAMEEALLLRNEESCPAGFGLEHPSGHKLWIHPTRIEACWILLTLKSSRKILGLITLPSREISHENVPHTMVDELITQFYQSAAELPAKLESIENA